MLGRMTSATTIARTQGSALWQRAARLMLALGLFGAIGSAVVARADPPVPMPVPPPSVEPRARSGAPRLIALNPSLAAIVFRLGAGESLVGVDDYSRQLFEEAAALPRVGGLFDPSLESVIALQPDRVLLVAGVDQQSHAQRLEKLGIEVEVFENERFDEVLENIARLGRILGREQAAAQRIEAILALRDAVEVAAQGRGSPGTVAVLDRSPLYVVGAETFLDEMLEIVGARNLGRSLGSGYPRGSIEWLITTGPELLLDMTPGREDSRLFWSRWPSLPAVATERVLTLDASRVSLPGPDLDRALRELAIAVHGAGIDAAIDAALESGGRVRSDASGASRR